MSGITTCLWFDDQGEEAAAFYVSLFPNSSIRAVSRYGPENPDREGHVLTVDFVLDGAPFTALNGGPQFTFSEAVSFQVYCADAAELDHYWNAFTADGEESMCGWCKDRYGVSWQIIPTELPQLLSDPDPARAQRAMQAMLTMRKLDVDSLLAAADG
jgi:predicted 3-demethylubiquinone-9 3-methyltransferase (glyoxalase superfamily)